MYRLVMQTGMLVIVELITIGNLPNSFLEARSWLSIPFYWILFGKRKNKENIKLHSNDTEKTLKTFSLDFKWNCSTEWAKKL